MSSEPVLRATDLSLFIKSGGREHKVVDRASFAIGRGEVFALVGESGSGKTMVARAIMRLLPPSMLRIAGELSLEGENLATASEQRLRQLRGSRMSMVFQEPMTSLNPLMTVETQIREALAVHGTAPVGERREHILKLLEDAQFPSPAKVAPLYPHELSGGMRQRVMIAMALANNPALLVADEPTTALDVTIQREILETLQRLRASYNLSVLFISHDLALVNRYADRIGVLYAGVMMESGPAAKVIRSPSHPYTRALLNCVPRPRVAGHLQSGIDGVVPRIEDWFEGCRFAPRCGRAEAATCDRGEVPVQHEAGGHPTRCHFPS